MYLIAVVGIIQVDKMRLQHDINLRCKSETLLFAKLLKRTVLKSFHCYEMVFQKRCFEFFLPTIRSGRKTVNCVDWTVMTITRRDAWVTTVVNWLPEEEK